jgi:di/tricarboxylate transporter
MTLDMWLALIILVIAVVLFVSEWLRVDVVAFGVVVALMVTRLLSPEEALSGFSNPVVITIAALFIVGAAVMQTGLAEAIGERILAIAGNHPKRLLVVIMATVALLSMFVSSTGTVALLLPAIVSMAVATRTSASKLLIPLSYGSLVGGASTLIGTAPNLIVSDLLRENGFGAFNFFSFTPIGLILFVFCVIYMVTLGRKLLPDHKPKQEPQRVATPEELVALYRLPDNIYRLRVRRSSDLVSQTIAASRLRQDFNLTILDIQRPVQPRSVAKIGDRRLLLQSNGNESIPPAPDTILLAGDILTVRGAASEVTYAAASLNLGVQPAEAENEFSLISKEAGISEILLPPRSSLIGRTLVETRFGTIYRLTVLGIRRPGVEGELDLKETRLQFGDTLLVQGAWQDILRLKSQPRDFVVMGQPEQMLGAPARHRAPVAMLILAGMLLIMITNWLPISTTSMLAALAMILSGCVTIDEAYDNMDWKSIVLIAGMLPMSIALERVGLVNLVAQWLTAGIGSLGPHALLGGLFLLTSLFTQLLSNTATTVLVAPIALAASLQLGVLPQALLMGVAVAASMAFATPVASPVNTLVMGAGRYSFSDFIKIGSPLLLLSLLVAVIFLPLLFPFQ